MNGAEVKRGTRIEIARFEKQWSPLLATKTFERSGQYKNTNGRVRPNEL
jgi:hypothetical protein